MSAAASEAWLLYDGDCPFCSNYVKRLRLQRALGPVALIDARRDADKLDLAHRLGYSIDEGMLLHLNGGYFHGSECLNRLALVSTPSNLFNRLNAALFRSAGAARIAYPVLRSARNLTLRLIGRKLIGD